MDEFTLEGGINPATATQNRLQPVAAGCGNLILHVDKLITDKIDGGFKSAATQNLLKQVSTRGDNRLQSVLCISSGIDPVRKVIPDYFVNLQYQVWCISSGFMHFDK